MAKDNCDLTELCEECPEWIFTLADLLMCMMGLFVILWVLKPGGDPQPEAGSTGSEMTEHEIEVLGAIRSAFGYVPDASSGDPIDMHLILKNMQKTRLRGGDGEAGMNQRRAQGDEGIDHDVTTIRQGNQSVIGGRLVYDAAAWELDDTHRAALARIADVIRGHRNVVLIKGHASLDDLPENADPDAFLDLSIRRGQAVAAYLAELGVERDILRVQGCGTFEPIAQRVYSDAGRAMNRRVEVHATDQLVTDFQDPVRAEPALDVTGD
ncbi:MAG: OmpA family protein [Phycisphaerae bacterium]